MVNNIKEVFSCASCVAVERRGHSEGLAFLWKKEGSIVVLGQGDHHIDTEVRLDGESPFRLTGYYGFASRALRAQSWDLLRDLSSRYTLPWCILGDFNDLLTSSEKRGRVGHLNSLFAGFKSAIEDCNLNDLGFMGAPYTWERGRGTFDWVEERLDRAFANRDWIDRFNQSRAFHLLQTTSDHLPMFLEL